MFVAAGINVTTDVKTITAKTLFERLAHLVPRFDKTIQKFCKDIAERRNAELHSADLPFRTMRLEAWEARYWHARSEEHTSELQSLMRISYAVFCLKKKRTRPPERRDTTTHMSSTTLCNHTAVRNGTSYGCSR